MRRAPGLVGVVADHGRLLFAVEGFYRSVEIDNPRRTEQGPGRAREMTIKPGDAIVLINAAERAPRGVFGDELAATQKRPVHGVVAHRCDVRVTIVAREDREHQGGEHFALGGCVVAGKRQRAIANEGVEQPAHLEELDEEGQLPERCDGRGGVPFDVYPTTESIECDHGPRAD